MNKARVLKDIPFELDVDAFFTHIRMEKESKRSKRIFEIIETASPYIRPVAMYKRAEIQMVDSDVFTIDGLAFKSREIVEILKRENFVFPNIVSCGPEIEAFCVDRKKVLEQYITMELCNFSCAVAREAMLNAIRDEFKMEESTELFPGEKGWDLQQGIQIFKIFSKETEGTGLSISEAGVPKPSRSAYGLIVGS